MKKEYIQKCVDIASFAAVCIATVLVVIFQFTGEADLVKIAMGFYAFGFLTLSVQFAFKVYEDFKKTKTNENIENKDENQEENNENLNENSTQNQELNKTQTKSKVWNIVACVGSFLVFVFTLVVLIIY